MSQSPVPETWARHFGLASVPLFTAQNALEGEHCVLLDGGHGSFALSTSKEKLWNDPKVHHWAWSSGLPHHVTVTDDEVAVVRWDSPDPEEFSRKSVESKLEAFYGYLTNDRVSSTRRVVDHLVQSFRRVRSLVDEVGLGDEQSVEAFLFALDLGMRRSNVEIGGKAAQGGFAELLPEGPLDIIIADMIRGPDIALPLQLLPDLAIRHAGSEIFQEAHFALTSTAATDLFGWIGPADADKVTRGSTHFTPPALARSIAEQTLGAIADVGEREELTIYDPACGSGSFLYEAVRTLRRLDFKGNLIVTGRDISPAAISMARFAMRFAQSDWAPPGGMTIDLAVSDFLVDEPARADLVLMNPPFLSWTAMPPKTRERTRELMGSQMKGRVDLSMVFVSRALKSLKAGGALGALLPSSLLSALSAESWRDAIAEEADIRMLAVLGDYGLFRHAMVQVSALVLSKKEGAAQRPETTLALLASNAADATGDALRAVRRGASASGAGTLTSRSGEAGWRAFEIPAKHFERSPTWRLIAPEATSALERLQATGITKPLGELFSVNQGVRTGDNAAFVVDEGFYRKLPASERKYFRPAAMGDNISGGQIIPSEYVFYPYDDGGLTIGSEEDLVRKLPTYFQKILSERKAGLLGRSDIRRSGREDWWGLSQRRSWGTSPKPRIVSKYFGQEGSFALDEKAEFVVVQGFAWFPRWHEAELDIPGELFESDEESDMDASSTLPTADLLAAYAALLNSEPFQKLLLLFSAYVGGGQADLSPRFVNNVPLPDLAALAGDYVQGRNVGRLEKLGQQIQTDDLEWRNEAKRAAIALYGDELFERL